MTPRERHPRATALRAAAPAVRSAARDAVRDALAVLAPVACSGCGAPDRSVCAPCRAALVARPRPVERMGVRAWAALEYHGAVAAVIRAFKDGGRTDAAGPLAESLHAAIVDALRAARTAAQAPVLEMGALEMGALEMGAPASTAVEVCTIPSASAAFRARGYAPVEMLLARCGIRSSGVLRHARAHVDQATLDADGRRANAHGALIAARPLAGRRFLIVDDVLTTGSTIAEAARALSAAGAVAMAVAVLAETPLRRTAGTADSPETLRDNARQGGYGGMTGVVDPPFRTG